MEIAEQIAELAPFGKLLRLKLQLRSPERSQAKLRVREELCKHRGVLRGRAAMA